MRPDLPELVEALQRGAILTSEMEVFFQVCPCKTIAVTGSDGKTTTTTIIAELLKAAGQTVYVGGNIGKPLLPDVDGMEPGETCNHMVRNCHLERIAVRRTVPRRK